MAIPSAVVRDFGIERLPYTCPRREKCPISWGNRAFCIRYRNRRHRNSRVFYPLLTKANGRFMAINGCANTWCFACCAARPGQALSFNRKRPGTVNNRCSPRIDQPAPTAEGFTAAGSKRGTRTASASRCAATRRPRTARSPGSPRRRFARTCTCRFPQHPNR